MAQVPGLELSCTDSNGVVYPVEPGVGVTLPGAGTYFFNVATTDSPTNDFYLKWAAAVAGVFTLETTSLPRFIRGASSKPDVADNSTNAGDWTSEDPPDAYVPVSGVGNSSLAAVVTAGGANIGSARYNVSGLSSSRARIRAALTAGGVVRCEYWGKDS